MSTLPSLAPLLCLPALSCQTDAACPQQGLCLVRGRNEPFQQWSQLVKALGSIQTPAVVTQGGLPTHKRGFGSGCSAQGGLSGSGAASERAGKNIWGGRGLGHEAILPSPPQYGCWQKWDPAGLSLHSVHGTGEVTLTHAWGTLCWTEPRAVTACTEHLVAVQGLGYRSSSSTHRVHLLGTADTERWE